jgi:2,3-dihydroxybenzoate decarboxylase
MIRKIALEEHFLCPGFEDYWKTTVGDVDPRIYGQIVASLSDFGARRIEAMDRAGIERSVLSLAGPGVQIERDPATAVRSAREANDFLAREVAKRPARYCGFAHLAMQDAKAAADELERCMRALIYIHPTDPVAPHPCLAGHKALKRATWEWGFETGSHALRLVFGGLFDRFPGVKIILGHLGETLPFLLWRFDSRAKLYGVKLARQPSDYIRDNIRVTLSGMFSAEPLNCTISALGHEHVMFSADYPFESIDEAAEFIDRVPLAAHVRADICFNNAARLLRLDKR